ncbi:uncharacterized protein LOC122369303 [Amphibalanus amphitrite]|uniref:uncharacterized protein LOC122369303 n=1 Tax=Amphibalanus amphitrite TaxID=1232801 RepID=UPI001C911B7D|nr:uncharacterized protein LOC122369303 [Amphibalanus amphitrite]
MRVIDLRTDSVTVHRWINDALSGRTRLRTKAHGEMLIRRRVDMIRQLVDELELSLSVTLVRSAANRADELTRVPKDWVRDESSPAATETMAGCEAAANGLALPNSDDDSSGSAVLRGGDQVAAAGGSSAEVDRMTPRGDSAGAAEDRTEDQLAPGGSADIAEAIAGVHDRAGHPGVRRTLYFARRDISKDVTRAQVQNVVSQCDACRSIDPAPMKWRHGSLEVSDVWKRLAIDVTHYRGQSFLSVVDCGPSRFCLWRHLSRPDADVTIAQLEQIFFERGAPEELLCDNDTIFRSRSFAAFAARWGVRLRFRAVHEPAGNSIVERNHRTIKVIAARKQCSVAEAVHLYNVTPREGGSAPASVVFRYNVRDNVRPAAAPPAPNPVPMNSEAAAYRVGDPVWVRRRGTRCVDASRPGTVSDVVSEQVVEVDGVPWHVRNLRRRNAAVEEGPVSEGDSEGERDGESLVITVPVVNDAGSEGNSGPEVVEGESAEIVGEEERQIPRRSERERRQAQYFQSMG